MGCTVSIISAKGRGHSGYGLSQWEMMLQCNIITFAEPIPKMISEKGVLAKKLHHSCTNLLITVSFVTKKWTRRYNNETIFNVRYTDDIISPCDAETWIIQDNWINTMAADALAHCVPTSSTTMLLINSLRPSDAIWRQWSWTTLAQVMACCLTAPSHYLNQCWLIIRGVLWHTSESSFAGIAQGIDSGYEFEKDILKNIFKSPRGQWVKQDKWVELYSITKDFNSLCHRS